ADNVAELVRQLKTDDSDKVRLSAALNLTKLGDQRAVRPLTEALLNDGDKSVRGVCAVGLGKLVTARTDAEDRRKAIDALTQARDSDESEFVKAQADRALKAIGVTRTTPAPTGATGIYVNIGPMSSKTGDSTVDGKLKALMVKVASQTMTKVANKMKT